MSKVDRLLCTFPSFSCFSMAAGQGSRAGARIEGRCIVREGHKCRHPIITAAAPPPPFPPDPASYHSPNPPFPLSKSLLPKQPRDSSCHITLNATPEGLPPPYHLKKHNTLLAHTLPLPAIPLQILPNCGCTGREPRDTATRFSADRYAWVAATTTSVHINTCGCGGVKQASKQG